MKNQSLKKYNYSNNRIKKTRKYCGLFLLGFSLIIAAKYLPIPEISRSGLRWISSLGFWSPITFIIIYNLATVLFIPGSILTLGGGVIFGVIWGSIYVFVAATLGATIAFMIGRYISRDWVFKQLNKHAKFEAIDRAVVKEGFKIVFLTRLCPLFPFNLLNYAFGVMQVSLKDYLLGSIGMIPGTVMYVYMGSLVSDVALVGTYEQPTSFEAEVMKWVINIVGFVATVVVTIYMSMVGKKALEKSL